MEVRVLSWAPIRSSFGTATRLPTNHKTPRKRGFSFSACHGRPAPRFTRSCRGRVQHRYREGRSAPPQPRTSPWFARARPRRRTWTTAPTSCPNRTARSWKSAPNCRMTNARTPNAASASASRTADRKPADPLQARHCAQPGRVAQFDVVGVLEVERPLLFELADAAADRFDGQPQVVGNVGAGHGQVRVVLAAAAAVLAA